MDKVALRLAFKLRGLAGLVTVWFGPNEHPERWGYGLLGLDYSIQKARGFPVLRADVSFPAEGYAAILGWVQIVRYTDHETGKANVIYDVAPQLMGADTPYMSFGVLPSLFDAPSITSTRVTWDASSFLVYTPDAVMTRVVHAICGFTWGYRVEDGSIELVSPTKADEADWTVCMAGLTEHYPRWDFGSSWSTS